MPCFIYYFKLVWTVFKMVFHSSRLHLCLEFLRRNIIAFFKEVIIAALLVLHIHHRPYNKTWIEPSSLCAVKIGALHSGACINISRWKFFIYQEGIYSFNHHICTWFAWSVIPSVGPITSSETLICFILNILKIFLKILGFQITTYNVTFDVSCVVNIMHVTKRKIYSR